MKNVYIISSIIIIALIMGYFIIPLLSHTPKNDSVHYDNIALSLTQNNGYPISGGFLRAPGYPFFLAIIYKLFGHNYYIVYIAQFLLLGLIAAFAFFLSKKFLKLNFKKSLLCAVSILAWPYLLLYSSYLLSEILYIFLLTAYVYHILNFFKDKRQKNFFYSAIFLALATLTRPFPLLLPFWIIIFIAFFGFIFKTKIEKKQLFALLISVFLLYLFISPWVIFASKKMDRFTPITSTFFDASKRANSSYNYEYLYVGYNNTDFAPGKEITLGMKIGSKIKNIFRFWKSGAEGYQAEALMNKRSSLKHIITLYRICYYLVIALAFFSFLYIRKNFYIMFFWILIGYTWGIHTLLYPSPRFTLPVIPFVIILANFSFWKIMELLKNKFKA